MSERTLATSNGLAAGATLLGLFAILAVIVGVTPGWVQGVDTRWFRWMLASRWPPATALAKALNVIGGGTVMWAIRGVIAAAFAYARRWRALTVFLLAEISAEACIGPIKSLIGRPRPVGSLVGVSGQAFPSGHVVTASVTAAVIVLLLVGTGRARRGWLLVAVSWSLVMAWSRTYLASHWMTDAIGGVLVGLGWALLWTTLVASPAPSRGQHPVAAAMAGDG